MIKLNKSINETEIFSEPLRVKNELIAHAEAKYEEVVQKIKGMYSKEKADQIIEKVTKFKERNLLENPQLVIHLLNLVVPSVAEFNFNKLSTLGSIFIAQIRRRLLERDQNVIIAIDGQTGSGKSFSAISLAMAIDPLFTIDNIFFTAKEFLNAQLKARKGQVLVWDETGVEFGSRDFATKLNKAISKVFQTMRFKNTAVILTVPRLNMIDKHARELIHYHIHSERILYSYRLALLKIYETYYIPTKDLTILRHPVISFGGVEYIIDKIAVKKIPKEIEKEYRKHKEAFFENFIMRKIDEEDEEALDKRKEIHETYEWARELAKRIINDGNVSKYIHTIGRRKIIDSDLIAIDYNLKLSKAKLVGKLILKELSLEGEEDGTA